MPLEWHGPWAERAFGYRSLALVTLGGVAPRGARPRRPMYVLTPLVLVNEMLKARPP